MPAFVTFSANIDWLVTSPVPRSVVSEDVSAIVTSLLKVVFPFAVTSEYALLLRTSLYTVVPSVEIDAFLPDVP